jgi:hypothetical protein
MRKYARRLVVALIAGAWFAPSQAQASCGDYVTVGSMPGHDGSSSSMPQSSSSQPQSQKPVDVPEPPRAPCRGPSCSAPPPAQPLSTSTSHVAPERSSDLGIVARVAMALAPPPAALQAQERSLHPIYRASDIYHPPR